MPISAQVIADSVSPQGKRITTLAIEFPTFLTKEINTHRLFSRSFMSSRAVPVQAMLKRVQEEPYIPYHWGKNQKGMSAGEECNNLIELKIGNYKITHFTREEWWKKAQVMMEDYAKDFSNAGYHKQVVNRLLEPFSYTVGIVTSTELDNFFNLRISPAAQPEMRILAEKIKEAMDGSIPKQLQVGEWHLPFTSDINLEEFAKVLSNKLLIPSDYYETECEVDLEENSFYLSWLVPYLRKVSAARCARISYSSNSRPKPFTIEEDLALADRLLKDSHMSPFEHQASPMRSEEEELLMEGKYWEEGVTHVDRNGKYWSGNFQGFIQARQLLQQV